MPRLRNALFVIVACTATALVAGPAFQVANGAEPDTTAPNLNVQTDLVVGSQIGMSNLLNGTECGTDNLWTEIPYRISWNATDASGITDYARWTTYPGDSPSFVTWWGDSREYPDQFFTEYLSDYDGSCGGGSIEQDGWAITAFDRAGNGKMMASRPESGVIQENGSSVGGDNPSLFKYSGTWSTSTCTCASGGRQVWTKQLGASVTFTVSGVQELGLVMAKGPGRGQADIFVDGSRVGTVDTRAATNTNRIIVWTRELGTATHTIQIKNLATAGRPRVDFDAIILANYYN